MFLGKMVHGETKFCNDGSPLSYPCFQQQKICQWNTSMICEEHEQYYFCCPPFQPSTKSEATTSTNLITSTISSIPGIQCKNNFKECEYWASRGLCLLDIYSIWTKSKLCADSCNLCYLLIETTPLGITTPKDLNIQLSVEWGEVDNENEYKQRLDETSYDVGENNSLGDFEEKSRDVENLSSTIVVKSTFMYENDGNSDEENTTEYFDAKTITIENKGSENKEEEKKIQQKDMGGKEKKEKQRKIKKIINEIENDLQKLENEAKVNSSTASPQKSDLINEDGNSLEEIRKLQNGNENLEKINLKNEEKKKQNLSELKKMLEQKRKNVNRLKEEIDKMEKEKNYKINYINYGVKNK